MEDEVLHRLECFAGISRVSGAAADTHRYFASPPGLSLAGRLVDHLSAYNATNDIVPYSGDFRLAHTEAQFQLQNAVCLAVHGFYSQACSTLRSVCELTLLQATLPEGEVRSDSAVNRVRLLGEDACLGTGPTASSLKEWAIDGYRTPKWQDMLKWLFSSDTAKEFDRKTQFRARLDDAYRNLNPFVHEAGFTRSAVGLSRGGMLKFSEEAITLFGTHLMTAAQLSVTILLMTFLPTATNHEAAASGFIDATDLSLALRILPEKDAKLLRHIYHGRNDRSS